MDQETLLGGTTVFDNTVVVKFDTRADRENIFGPFGRKRRTTIKGGSERFSSLVTGQVECVD